MPLRSIDPREVRRILIRANNWIGDVVMISPAVRAIRARFREAHVSILGKRWVLEALRGDPVYDRCIEYESSGAHRGVRGRLRLARALRAERFDLAVLFQKALDAAVLAFLARARFRVGYVADGRRPLLTHPLAPPPADTHHVEVFLGIARALGCAVEDPYPSFHLGEDDRRAAAAWMSAAGIEEGTPVVALHPGASKTPRAWHPERYAAVGRRLAESRGARILIIGSSGEREIVARVAGGIPARAIITPPRDLPIRATGALIERCRLFIGNDSGPMHVAAALGVPTIGLFGPGTPRRTAPLSRRSVVAVGRDYPCSPCRQDFFRECPPAPSGKPFCLEEIGDEEVTRAAERLLDPARAAAL